MNIIFESIIINNFLSIGSAQVSLNDQGFILVRGENNESGKTQSNGSGKSSIFDAIIWTITGETMRGASNIVNEKSDQGCTCELNFYVDDTKYRVVRYKDHPENGNSCDFYENDELLSNQIKRSQEMINKRIPALSTEILSSIVLLGQGLPYKFSSLSPINRKNLLETMSGSASQVDHLKYQLDTKSAEINQELQDATLKSTKIEYEISSNTQLIDQLKSSQDISVDSIDKEISQTISEIKELESQIASIDQELPGEQETLSKIKEVHSQVSQYKGQVLYECNDLSEKIRLLGTGICPTCNRPYDNYEEIQSQIEAYNKEYREKSDLLKTLEQKCTATDIQITEYSNMVNNLINTKSSAEYTISTKQSEIERLSNDKTKIRDIENTIKNAETRNSALLVNKYDISEQINQLTGMQNTVDYIKRQVSRDFKGYLLSEVINFLSLRSSYYGDYLFEGHKINVKLKGNKILIAIDDRQYENLSGGERQRVDLAVQFALRDVLVMTTGFSCNLLVLDEVFDNLDMQGSNDLISLISTEFSDINSVFTITHHSDISIPYDKILTVIKDNSGVSVIKEE